MISCRCRLLCSFLVHDVSKCVTWALSKKLCFKNCFGNLQQFKILAGTTEFWFNLFAWGIYRISRNYDGILFLSLFRCDLRTFLGVYLSPEWWRFYSKMDTVTIFTTFRSLSSWGSYDVTTCYLSTFRSTFAFNSVLLSRFLDGCHNSWWQILSREVSISIFLPCFRCRMVVSL